MSKRRDPGRMVGDDREWILAGGAFWGIKAASSSPVNAGEITVVPKSRLSAALDALEDEWQSNHIEHCTNVKRPVGTTDRHEDGSQCHWPRPKVSERGLIVRSDEV